MNNVAGKDDLTNLCSTSRETDASVHTISTQTNTVTAPVNHITSITATNTHISNQYNFHSTCYITPNTAQYTQVAAYTYF